MSELTVTVLDTIGIQGYIFNSNRLRENIGASQLVREVTNDWVKATLALDEIGLPESEQDDSIQDSDLNGLPAGIVYLGGGNAVLLFKSRELASEFVRILSKKVLKEAPGINLVAAHRPFDWDSEQLRDVVNDLFKTDLERNKRGYVPSAPLLGLSVTAACQSTQLPAIGWSDAYISYDPGEEDDRYLISREVKTKLDASVSANERLKKLFRGIEELKNYEFPNRTDQLGRSEGESSYAAIVHADGNSIGQRIRDYIEKHNENSEYIHAMRDFSKKLECAGQQALRAVIKKLLEAIGQHQDKFSLKQTKEGKYYLPFRPLVYGGDDVTFVCEGRLGLELAAIYLQALEEQSLPDEKPIKACAGISIVKTHYPFARAYELSEELCRSAKKYLRDDLKSKSSAMDWHFAASGLLGSLAEIRSREYTVAAGNLCMRPIEVAVTERNWRNWADFQKVVRDFLYGKDWQGRRNKVMALREVLRSGGDATEQFLKNSRSEGKLCKFPQNLQISTRGWLDKVCGYFDAIEAMEFYVGLEDR